MDAISKAGYEPSVDVALALDAASSELAGEDGYDFAREGKLYTPGDLITRYEALLEKYPIISLEDGLADSDWRGANGKGCRLAYCYFTSFRRN